MEEAAPAWEQSKENAAPLERGRNVKVLERMMQAQETEEERLEKERMVRHYERLVQPSESDDADNTTDDDPLIHWLSYIKFHQDAFPADTHAQFLLMERCTRALVKRKQYANDVRFIRVCVSYADKTSFPGDVFKYLHQQKVGSHTALFWIAWAWVAENKGDYAFAEKVFLKGISKDAKPLNVLKQRHKQFQRRMSRHWLNTNNSEQELDETEDGRRGALGALSDEAARANDRRSEHPSRHGHHSSMSTFVDRSSSRSTAPTDNGAAPKGGGFQIFVDENAENHDGHYNLDQSHIQHDDRDIGREEDRRKENEAAAERWNERGGLSSSSAAMSRRSRADTAPARVPAFDVFVDEECAAKLKREQEEKQKAFDEARYVRDERTLRQRTDEGVAERLARDPMRYVRNPSKLEEDQAHDEQPVASSSGGERKKKDDKVGSLVCGFSKRLVSKDESGQERCFEEGRAKARCYSLANPSKNVNLLAVRQPMAATTDDSTMDIDDTQSFDMDDLTKERKRPHSSSSSGVPPMHSRSMPKKNLFGADTSMDSHNQALNTSTASSTVNERDAVGAPTGKEEETINTKLAMKELSMMFSSPALGLQETAEPARKTRRSSGTVGSVRGGDDGDTATFSLVAGLINDGTPGANDNSILAASRSDRDAENVAPRNPLARSTVSTGALRAMDEDEVPVARVLSDRPVDDRTGGAFEIYCDEEEEEENVPLGVATQAVATNAELSFEIYQDEPSNGDHRDSGGDTATFSLVGETLKALADASSPPKPAKEPETKGPGFSIFLDDDSIGDMKTFDKAIADAPDFGDISGIVPNEADLTTTGRHSVLAPPSHAIDYAVVHNIDVRSALRQLQYEAREMALQDSSSNRDQSLSYMLAKRGCIYDMPSLSLPRGFCKHSSMQGSEITLGDKTGVVSGELGRGTYGVVVLMDISQRWQGSPHDTCIAVKAQTPTDCLALEYVLLKKIEDRTGSHRTSKDPKAPFPFPRPLSFVSLADGGLLGMTAGSRTGLNLVDLVNVYKISERSPVPELIALHYTARMLLVLELLHWHGKILHCDVKPDNWVLMESATAFVSCRDEIEASDLMLVDFGRAVDLTDAAKGGIDPMDVKLFGDAAGEDMACVAMRKGLGWSFDVDTYGLCASAHVLLFGTHLEVEEDHSSRRWKPRKPLRRYWQKEIWQEVFDTLLNLDEVTGNAIGSRSRSLRSLRTMIEDHLSDRGRELESLLRHQARILPSSRPT